MRLRLMPALDSLDSARSVLSAPAPRFAFAMQRLIGTPCLPPTCACADVAPCAHDLQAFRRFCDLAKGLEHASDPGVVLVRGENPLAALRRTARGFAANGLRDPECRERWFRLLYEGREGEWDADGDLRYLLELLALLKPT